MASPGFTRGQISIDAQEAALARRLAIIAQVEQAGLADRTEGRDEPIFRPPKKGRAALPEKCSSVLSWLLLSLAGSSWNVLFFVLKATESSFEACARCK